MRRLNLTKLSARSVCTHLTKAALAGGEPAGGTP
ncbi:MAG: hypothetical protein RI907_1355 [Pseudomonadota bacterium]|jgi:hypothetical protein